MGNAQRLRKLSRGAIFISATASEDCSNLLLEQNPPRKLECSWVVQLGRDTLLPNSALPTD